MKRFHSTYGLSMLALVLSVAASGCSETKLPPAPAQPVAKKTVKPKRPITDSTDPIDGGEPGEATGDGQPLVSTDGPSDEVAVESTDSSTGLDSDSSILTDDSGSSPDGSADSDSKNDQVLRAVRARVATLITDMKNKQSQRSVSADQKIEALMDLVSVNPNDSDAVAGLVQFIGSLRTSSGPSTNQDWVPQCNNLAKLSTLPAIPDELVGAAVQLINQASNLNDCFVIRSVDLIAAAVRKSSAKLEYVQTFMGLLPKARQADAVGVFRSIWLAAAGTVLPLLETTHPLIRELQSFVVAPNSQVDAVAAMGAMAMAKEFSQSTTQYLVSQAKNHSNQQVRLSAAYAVSKTSAPDRDKADLQRTLEGLLSNDDFISKNPFGKKDVVRALLGFDPANRLGIATLMMEMTTDTQMWVQLCADVQVRDSGVIDKLISLANQEYQSQKSSNQFLGAYLVNFTSAFESLGSFNASNLKFLMDVSSTAALGVPYQLGGARALILNSRTIDASYYESTLYPQLLRVFSAIQDRGPEVYSLILQMKAPTRRNLTGLASTLKYSANPLTSIAAGRVLVEYASANEARADEVFTELGRLGLTQN